MAVTRIYDADAGEWIIVGGDVGNVVSGMGYVPGEPVYYNVAGSYSFTKADFPGAVAFRVQVQGAGGGGGGADTTAAAQVSAGGGGGGGGYAESVIPASDLDAVEAITVGVGGVGAAGAGGAAGADSVFDTIPSELRGSGGAGGANGSASGAIFTVLGGNGGSATGGDLIIGGGPGVRGIYANTTSPRGGGEGGNSHLGGGGVSNAGNTVGSTGRLYGGGGGGASNAASQGTARAGGTGALGVVIVTPLYAPTGMAFSGLGYAAGEPIYYTADGSLAKGSFPGAIAFLIECQAGGGGSGGTSVTTAGQVAVAGPGAGGEYARSIVPASDLDVTEAVTVGQGGAAAIVAGNGGAGGDSVVDTISDEIRAIGGGFGGPGSVVSTFPTSTGAPGGAGTGGKGQLLVPGDEGTSTMALSTTRAWVGEGGRSFLGANRSRGFSGASSAATPGRLYGGGAFGAVNIGALAAQVGAVGGNGIVIVTPLYPNLAGELVADLAALQAAVAAAPKGQIGYAEITSSQAGITTETDITGLSVTVTVGAGRRIRILGYARLTATVATDRFIVDVKEGATYLGLCGDLIPGASVPVYHGGPILTPSAGSHTYRLTARRISGTGSGTATAAVTSPLYIVVEDLGAA